MGLAVSGGLGGGGDRLADHRLTGVAGIGELYGLSRVLTLPLAAAALLAVVATGSYRRVERTAIVVGLFELAFFAVAWAAHPSLAALAKDALDLPLGNREFMFLVAAVIGATFNPWMIFYQQSAIADKKLRPDDLAAARWDTAFGAVLTQCLTGAVLVAAAATLYSGGASAGLGECRRDQQCAVVASRGQRRPLGLQRRRPRRLSGGCHRVLAGFCTERPSRTSGAVNSRPNFSFVQDEASGFGRPQAAYWPVRATVSRLGCFAP